LETGVSQRDTERKKAPKKKGGFIEVQAGRKRPAPSIEEERLEKKGGNPYREDATTREGRRHGKKEHLREKKYFWVDYSFRL